MEQYRSVHHYYNEHKNTIGLERFQYQGTTWQWRPEDNALVVILPSSAQQTPTTMSKTIGEQRLRIDFNPSNEDGVYQNKAKVAELINEAERVKREHPDPEVKRVAALAATALEEGCMWLVKALTAPKPVEAQDLKA
ncbi:MAG TPA: hypothetical protein PLB89_05360 [Flavobacteriales bacterium]|nr:hypothetical protein [Flavobacteriales bacterium]